MPLSHQGGAGGTCARATGEGVGGGGEILGTFCRKLQLETGTGSGSGMRLHFFVSTDA